MKKETTEKQLVERLLLYIKLNGVHYGLCGVVQLMTVEKKFNRNEEAELLEIIEKNRPILPAEVYTRNRGFYWFPGKLEPRIEFLERIISKL